jgi:YD repeat-containing protein
MFARRMTLAVLVVLCAFGCVLVVGVGSAGAVVSQFGGEGEGAGQIEDPKGIAVDQATGDVYLLDRGNGRVDEFTAEGTFVMAWGWGVADGVTQAFQTCTTTCFRDSTPQEALNNETYVPSPGHLALGLGGVAVDNDPLSVSYQDVYVSEGGANSRVEKFSSSGGFISMFGKEVNENGSDVCVAGEKCQAGKKGSGDGEFNYIQEGAIAVGPTGNVFVGDHERVQEFSPEGALLASFALGDGYTKSVAVDGAGDIYVVSYIPGSLREYDASGALVRTLDGEGQPEAVTLDASGNLLVDEESTRSDRVLEYGPGGEELSSLNTGMSLRANGGFAFGEGIGALYVAQPPQPDQVRLLVEAAQGPLVLAGSESATSVLPRSAKLNATVNPENRLTTYRFEYGTSTAYGTSVPVPDGEIPASFEDTPVSAELSGLSIDTTYHYRIVAANSKGTFTGPDETFTTLPPALVDSESSINVASSSATLEGQVNPLGSDTTYRFEYGTSESYGASAPVGEGDAGPGLGDVTVSVHLQGLEPATTYHYRLVTTNVLGVTVGGDRVFATQPAVGAGAVLSDGRSWEMVSPVDKLGAAVLPLNVWSAAIQASLDGEGITYLAGAATETGAAGNRADEATQLLSIRGGSGWTTRDIDTANEAIGGAALGISEYRLFSPDLSLGLVEPRSDTPLPPLPKGAKRTVYLRNDLSGEYEALVTAGNVQPGAEFGIEKPKGSVASFIQVLDATPDLSNVVFSTLAALTPDAVEAGESQSLYEWAGGKVVLVSVLPNGEAADRNDPESANLGDESRSMRHAVSDDGSRVVWETGQAAGKHHLYLRDVARSETAQIDAAKGIKEVENDESRFQVASSDGSRVFFTSMSRLTADSTASFNNRKADLYVFEVTSLSDEPLAGGLTDLTVDGHAGESADVQGVIGTSEDGTMVYFAAKGLLDNVPISGTAGLTNLYVERYDKSAKAWSAPALVAKLSSVDAPSWGDGLIRENLARMSSHVSRDGRFLSFMSSRSLTGYDNRDANSGIPDEEVFLYDQSTGRVSCVSCDRTGARPTGVLDPNDVPPGLLVDYAGLVWGGQWLAALIPSWTLNNLSSSTYQSRYLSDSGRLFFDSPQALVPGDTNGTWDVYEFEPLDVGGCVSGSVGFEEAIGGCVGLVSSGGSGEESAFLDASETGDDVFFLTEAGLVPQDEDGLFDVYDARVCSESRPCLPAGHVASPACSTSDSCKAAPTPQPEGFGAPSSQTFSGAGNIIASTVGTVKVKSLTRAQKLARALKACRTKLRRKRASCARQARKRYGRAARAKRSRAKRSLVNKGLPVRAGR